MDITNKFIYQAIQLLKKRGECIDHYRFLKLDENRVRVHIYDNIYGIINIKEYDDWNVFKTTEINKLVSYRIMICKNICDSIKKTNFDYLS